MGDQKQLARESKEKGNIAYKSKEFDTAIEHYKKAIELDPTEITFVSNLVRAKKMISICYSVLHVLAPFKQAAVYFERKEWDECVRTCERAVEVGRENRADFKLIAKALARMGNAFRRNGDLEKAKWAFEKALTEHRTPDYKSSLSEVRRLLRLAISCAGCSLLIAFIRSSKA